MNAIGNVLLLAKAGALIQKIRRIAAASYKYKLNPGIALEKLRQGLADCQLIFAPIRVEVSHHSAEYRIFGQSQLGTKLSAGDQQSSRIDPIVDDHEVGSYINALFLGKPGRQFFAQKHAGMDAWKDKSQNQSVLRAGIDSVQSQYPLDVGAARRQVHM